MITTMWKKHNKRRSRGRDREEHLAVATDKRERLQPQWIIKRG
jgi:hypothetical protein